MTFQLITADDIRSRIENDLAEKGFFIVALQVSTSRKISVYVDTVAGITLEECAGGSRFIEQKLDPGNENFEIEVSSPGIGNPLKYPFQYEKNIGRYLRIVSTEGITAEGIIKAAGSGSVTLEFKQKQATREKTKIKQPAVKEFFYKEIKTAKVLIR